MTWWDSLLLNANAIVCLLIAMRLMFFQRKGARFRRSMSIVAYTIILVTSYITFRIWFGQYLNIDPAEVVLNIAICIAVWRAGGNIAQVIVRG